jgi:ketol-acid reductoisomerase
MKAGFDTLVEAGYQPEAAYFECIHELKLIVDLIYQGGLNYMRYSVSDTAEWGDYTAGPQIINAETRRTMKDLLTKIQNGEFAKRWIDENKTGRKTFIDTRRKEQTLLVEQVGARLRALMPFLNPVEIKPESGAVASSKP